MNRVRLSPFAALALAAANLIAAPASADDAPPPMISVTGEGRISVPPDQASVDGGVSTQAKTAREASDANNAAMGKVLLALKAAGIDEKDFQTSRLSLQPQYQQNRPGSSAPNAVTGYLASNSVTVRLRDVTAVASVVDTLVNAGANEIGGIGFSVVAASKLLDEAREQAIADARRKAEIYARAAGVTLGAPISIAEGSGFEPMPYRKMSANLAAAAPVAAGEETLSVTVSVSYAIKPQ
ncbi:MAG TPA: SIMPL domain-containing protein [Rhodopseudomonas sp.]|uniref:SIMPL domain-containing protein n=1 Tax=Rhodopseudomonas sp. TaxID=1078 RepID=UPI002ED89AD0